MKYSLLPIAAMMVLQMGCKPRDFNVASVNSQINSQETYSSWRCAGTGGNNPRKEQGHIRLYLEKESLTYVVDKDGALRQAIAPRTVRVEIVADGAHHGLGKCQGQEVARLNAKLLHRSSIASQAQSKTQAMLERFTVDPKGQSFFSEAGTQLFSENSPAQCPLIESFEFHAEDKKADIFFCRKTDVAKHTVLSQCFQDSLNSSVNICSMIKCD